MNERTRNPNWQPPGTVVEAKPKAAPRDYIGAAVAALGTPVGSSVIQNQHLIAAIIIAQALDRFGEKLVDAAAVSQYKRT